MRLLKITLAVFLMAATFAHGAININWSVGYGVYPEGAADVTAVAPGTGVAAGNDVLWQLILAPSGTISIVDPFNPLDGFVGGDNEVLQTRVIPAGGDSVFDEWLYNSGTSITPYTNSDATLIGQTVFQRVFNVDSPSVGDWYFDGELETLVDRTNPALPPQEIFLGSFDEGVALNQQVIPEPSTLGLILVGMVGMMYRRYRMS